MATHIRSGTDRDLPLPIRKRTGSARPVPGLRRVLVGWSCAYRTWLQQRRDVAHLGQLPDYLLKDIGLTRDEIACIRRRKRIATRRGPGEPW